MSKFLFRDFLTMFCIFKLIAILTLGAFSKNAFSNVLKEGSLIVNLIDSEEHLDELQKKKWLELCRNLSSKFEVSKGYWSTGIAKGSECQLGKKMEEVLEKKKLSSYKKSISTIQKKQKFELNIFITGEIPANLEGDKTVIEKFIGAPLSLWDGLKRQLFHEKIEDSRQINFELLYLDGKKKLVLSSRSYQYNQRFLGFFELDGFTDILALDILSEAPMQWALEALKYNKEEKVYTIPVVKQITDFTLNKNLYFVRPYIIDGETIKIAHSDAVDSEFKKDLNLLNAANAENPIVRYIEIKVDSIPDYKGTFLSFGFEPVSRYYIHKKFDYLLRKLSSLDLTFYFADSLFGISQILDTNDEISYVGFRLAKGISEVPTPLDQYINIDFSLNKGPLRGIKTSLDIWPNTTYDTGDIKKEIMMSRLLLGYRFSLMLPLLGGIDLSPTMGLWNYKIAASSEFVSKENSKSSIPTLGVEAGYRLNIIDFILYGYFRYSSGLGVEDINSMEVGADIGYKINNLYKMRTIDPAVYGFVLYQSTEINDSTADLAIKGISSSGLVIGFGGSVAWE